MLIVWRSDDLNLHILLYTGGIIFAGNKRHVWSVDSGLSYMKVWIWYICNMSQKQSSVDYAYKCTRGGSCF